ncbi:MAG: helix-turn-helix domain-containing protein [Frankiaceae bacterium]
MNRNISDVTRQLMLKDDTSRDDLAAALNISTKSLARRLNGEIPWLAPEVQVMADLFGAPVQVFFGGLPALFSGAGITTSPFCPPFSGESRYVAA